MNCGDGSAYPVFFTTKELAEIHQEYLYEGWGEPCVGSISIQHEGKIHIYDAQTAEDYLDGLISEGEWANKKELKAVKEIVERDKR